MRCGETDRVSLLREASTTLKVVMRPDALRRAEPDIAALMEAEGIAMRPGPRPMFSSSRCVAKLCRRVCGAPCLAIYAIRAAAWQARLS
jgi:hypothetical protein